MSNIPPLSSLLSSPDRTEQEPRTPLRRTDSSTQRIASSSLRAASSPHSSTQRVASSSLRAASSPHSSTRRVASSSLRAASSSDSRLKRKRSHPSSWSMQGDFNIASKVSSRPQGRISGRPEWAEKKASLFLGKLHMNGSSYRVEKISVGSFHSTFKFLDKGTIKLNGKHIPLSDIVLKTFNYAFVNPKKIPALVKADLNGYEYLRNNGIPVTHFYVEPTTFVDTVDPKNGMFWLIEKMDEKITGDEWKACGSFEELDKKSQMILKFAKKWLTQMAVEKKEIINDFRKRNTMLKDNEIKIVDPGMPEQDKDDISYNIGRYAIDWANGNEVIFDWLTSDFPDDMKPAFSKPE